MKIKTLYRCQQCGYSTSRWLGRCPDCSQWNSFTEEQEMVGKPAAKSRSMTPFSSELATLSDQPPQPLKRISTNIQELDRVLGGGVVPGSFVLLGGAPGIGKSTIMLQVATGLYQAGWKGLYVSGEESLGQVQDRAHRLNLKAPGLTLLSETELGKIHEAIDKVKPNFCVIDSIQTIYREDLASAPGSVGQVRECAAELMRMAKAGGITIFVLGHVTKEGDLAGPRVLEHMVDTVLYFEAEREQIFRMLRAYKNRFGPTHEVGVFRMTGTGVAGVSSPSEMLLSERSQAPGATVVASIEGTRPMLLEVQALVARTPFGFPKRMVTGIDYNRALLLIAVLEKRLGLHLESEDVFVNVVGGLKIREPAVDLGVALSIASAHRNQTLSSDTVWVGEVGLGGEIRSASHVALRIAEAAQLGFKRIVVPKQNLKDKQEAGAASSRIQVIGVQTLADALSIASETASDNLSERTTV